MCTVSPAPGRMPPAGPQAHCPPSPTSAPEGACRSLAAPPPPPPAPPPCPAQNHGSSSQSCPLSPLHPPGKVPGAPGPVSTVPAAHCSRNTGGRGGSSHRGHLSLPLGAAFLPVLGGIHAPRGPLPWGTPGLLITLCPLSAGRVRRAHPPGDAAPGEAPAPPDWAPPPPPHRRRGPRPGPPQPAAAGQTWLLGSPAGSHVPCGAAGGLAIMTSLRDCACSVSPQRVLSLPRAPLASFARLSQPLAAGRRPGRHPHAVCVPQRPHELTCPSRASTWLSAGA